jgi:predicted HicB family RNase H-like nuclease
MDCEVNKVIDKKMSDADIKKALELCAILDENNCKKCPCREVCNEVDGELTKMVLDLINRKDAEIERLNNELVSADEVIGFREAEIERLQEVTTNTVNSSIRFGLDKEQEIRKAKSEAYKEFAERLQQEIQESKYRINDSPYARACNQVADWCIEVSDNLVKEMTEGGNEE